MLQLFASLSLFSSLLGLVASYGCRGFGAPGCGHRTARGAMGHLGGFGGHPSLGVGGYGGGGPRRGPPGHPGFGGGFGGGPRGGPGGFGGGPPGRDYGLGHGGYAGLGGVGGGHPGLGIGGLGHPYGGLAGLGGHRGLGGPAPHGLGGHLGGGYGGGYGGLGGGALGPGGAAGLLGDPLVNIGPRRKPLPPPDLPSPGVPWLRPDDNSTRSLSSAEAPNATSAESTGEEGSAPEVLDPSSLTEKPLPQTLAMTGAPVAKPVRAMRTLRPDSASKATLSGEKISNVKDQLESGKAVAIQKGQEDKGGEGKTDSAETAGEIPPPPDSFEEEEEASSTASYESTAGETRPSEGWSEEEEWASTEGPLGPPSARCPTPQTPDCWMYWVEEGADGCSCIDADGHSRPVPLRKPSQPQM